MFTNKWFETNLKVRVISRDQDEDFFVETEYYPTNVELNIPDLSRIQFPLTRAIIIRTTPASKRVTVHILQDTDLHSSIANFEIDLNAGKLQINKESGYVLLHVIE